MAGQEAGAAAPPPPPPTPPPVVVDRFGFYVVGDEQQDESARRRESVAAEDTSLIRLRETKWLLMLSSWDVVMRGDFKVVRGRCRKGIPRSVRGRAWSYLCGAAYLREKNPGAYGDLLVQDGLESCVDDIRKDVHRQFPGHEMFGEVGGVGQEGLFSVLKAYSILNREVGYCQAMAPLAATLLMQMPSEDAFWALTALCDKYLIGYYAPGMAALQLDGQILFGLLKRVSLPAYKHLKRQGVEPVLYMTEWFLCCFTRTLPWPSVLRVWDMLLCEGVKVLFRTALVLLKYTLGSREVLNKCNTLFDTLNAIKSPPAFAMQEEFLMLQINKLDVSDHHLRKEHFKQLLRIKKARATNNLT